MNGSSWIPQWFDVVVIGAAALGVYRGRRHGISGELLPLLQWLSIFFMCGTFYEGAGLKLSHALHINPNVCFVIIYLLIAVLTVSLFGMVQRMVGNKLVSKDFFGDSEYYLGIAGGALHMIVIVMVGLSLLCASYVTEQELFSMQRFQRENFGGITFPTPNEMKYGALNYSVSGRLARRFVGGFFIDARPPEPEQPGYFRYEDPKPAADNRPVWEK
jgi:uncharacterized membrane protein required for colicin V production